MSSLRDHFAPFVAIPPFVVPPAGRAAGGEDPSGCGSTNLSSAEMDDPLADTWQPSGYQSPE